MGEFLRELLHSCLSVSFVIIPACFIKVSGLFSIFLEAIISLWFHNVFVSIFLLFEVTAL